MSLILVVAPKRYLPGNEETRDEILKHLGHSTGLFLGSRYADTPEVHTDLNDTGTWLAQWTAANGNDDGIFALEGGKWAASTANKTAHDLMKKIRSRAGSIYFSEPVWGSFAAVHGDRGSSRIIAWNTVPSIDPIYFGEDEDYFYISNRPVMCKLAMARKDLGPEDLDHTYMVEYLEFGYSFSGVSPFKGVRTLPSRSALSIYGSSYSFIPAPQQASHDVEERDDARFQAAPELAHALINAAERCMERSAYPELQIRLSGGFDSRLLLGLFRRSGKENIICVTHGVEADREVAIASEITALAGVEHIVKAPEPLVEGDYFASLTKSILDSGGLIPSESLVAPFSPTAPFHGGGAISLGQWPLFKGYLDKIPTAEEAIVAFRIATRAAGLVNEENSEHCARVVEGWMSSMAAVSNVEVLYNFARDQRSSRYLEAQTSQTDRECQVLYPLVDSEVTAISDAVPLTNRALNYASFLALQEIWPEALAVPLNTTQTLRFEANGHVEGISGDFFAERRREPRPFEGSVLAPSYAGTQFEQTAAAIEFHAAEFVHESASWTAMKSMLDDEFVETIERVLSAGPADSGRLFETYEDKKNARVALSRLALASMWMTGMWL